MKGKTFADYLTPEDRLHAACVTYIDMQYPKALYFHAANEGRRSMFERYKAKVLRLKPGVPDLLIFEPRNGTMGLAIELKAGKNKLSEHQKEWISKLEERNWKCAKITSLDQFIKTVDEYLKK